MRYSLPIGEGERQILELVSRTGSIRRAAQELGGLEKRRMIRRVLRKVVKLLAERGIIRAPLEGRNEEASGPLMNR
ncbi:MAG: hypothetical protein DRM97_06455 [Thermoprotei archaeon]|nr:MAG: hypothetical protein DRM97_06455 [Thermoprotei archaeon]